MIRPVARPSSEAFANASARACSRIAPLWPLESFVAVNPFLGYQDLGFAATAAAVGRTAGARLVLDRQDYLRALADGRITARDVEEALSAARGLPGLPESAADLLTLAHDPRTPRYEPRPLATVADVATRVTGHDWAAVVHDCIGAWAAAHFDRGQAAWRSPWRGLEPFAAWRAEAAIDRTPDLAGLAGFRETVRALPETADEAARVAARAVGAPERAYEAYFTRLLMSIPGWAGHAAWRDWDPARPDARRATVAELLSIRLAWEHGLLATLDDPRIRSKWREELAAYPADPGKLEKADAALAIDLVLHDALERGAQRDLARRLARPRHTEPCGERPRYQAVACIDVRSELLRRALEGVEPEMRTLGFAGFFGVPVEHVPLGAEGGSARCPVLVAPSFVVPETVVGASAAEQLRARQERRRSRWLGDAGRAFKLGAISSFGFVETLGLGYGVKLVAGALGKGRPVPPPDTDGVPAALRHRLGPDLAPGELHGRPTGLTQDERVAAAEGVLRGMSLTEGFARVVLLVGHGSTTVNNPHAAGLQCGACGGHAGDASARIAAVILNDPAVRQDLSKRGIAIPSDTHFVAARHDTTSDEVTLLDTDAVPRSHHADLEHLRRRLVAAGRLARGERAARLGVEPGPDLDRSILRRSSDWSETRPEWGLAGCMAFIAAPRSRTAGIDLEGRSFLHEYDWHRDEDFSVLESILGAPMVVASWIGLQYFGSSVDNRVLGSGNKTLHNVVGALGVLEGNDGDLRVGLPWQSVHDGSERAHEPLRLNVMVEAPLEAIDGVIASNESVRRLVGHGWVHLFALDAEGRVSHRRRATGGWQAISSDARARHAA